MTIRLSAGKLAALQEMIRSWLGRKSCKRWELESLVGSLNHACCIVRHGKTFLRRLLEMLSIARHSHNFLRLNATCRSDWYSYLGLLNHASFFRTIPSRVHHYSFTSDASGSISCGAIWISSWFQFKWAEAEGVQFHELGGDSITFKELLPVVLSVADCEELPVSSTPVTGSRFVHAIRLALSAVCVNSACYSGHSFRIGAATTAAFHGVPDVLIKTTGRWESSAYTLYVRTPRDQLCAVAQSLSQ